MRRRGGEGGGSPLQSLKFQSFFGENASNSGNKPAQKVENKPKNVNITSKTNYINRNRLSIGNTPNFVIQKSIFFIYLLSFSFLSQITINNQKFDFSRKFCVTSQFDSVATISK